MNSPAPFRLAKTCSAVALIALCLATPALSQEIEDSEPRRTTRRTRSTRPPAMIGDFFGAMGSSPTVVTNFSDPVVHHTTSINDMHGIVLGPGLDPASTATFSGGPFGGDFYFGPGGPAPPLGDVVTDLTYAPTGTGGFVAARTSDTVTIGPLDDAGAGLFNVPVYAVGLPVLINVPNPSASGAVVGRVKMAENASPIPQDRVFFNYSYFDNVALTPGGVAVNRFVPGIERTFVDSQMSVEFRVPFASTLDSDIFADGPTPTGRGEFGNLSLIAKALLTSNESLATSVGLQLTLPTASDVRVLLMDGTELIKVENKSVHLMPFAAALYTPNDSFFAQAFLQFDFDANGNPLKINTTGQGLTHAGRLNDRSYLYLDISLGWFMYRSPSPCSKLTAITPMVELHYNRSLQSGDAVSRGGFLVGDLTSTFEALNLVVGTAFQFGPQSSFTVGYTVPVGGGRDQVYDGELRAFFTRYLR